MHRSWDDKHGAFGMSHDPFGDAPYQSMLNTGATVSRHCDEIGFTFSTATADFINRHTDRDFSPAAYISGDVKILELLHQLFS